MKHCSAFFLGGECFGEEIDFQFVVIFERVSGFTY